MSPATNACDLSRNVAGFPKEEKLPFKFSTFTLPPRRSVLRVRDSSKYKYSNGALYVILLVEKNDIFGKVRIPEFEL